MACLPRLDEFVSVYNLNVLYVRRMCGGMQNGVVRIHFECRSAYDQEGEAML